MSEAPVAPPLASDPLAGLARGVDDKIQILVVDDHPENLLALEAMLGSAARHVVTASSGAEALRKLLHQEFAVILLDVMMPGMDGFETARLIRGRDASRHTPIIFLTATGSDVALIYRAYSVGAVDYLIKPLQPEIVRAKVDVFIELHRRALRIRQQETQLREAERVRSAEALRASETQYEATFNQAAIGIAHLSPEGRQWLRANRHLCDVLGYSEGELCKLRYDDLVDGENVAADRLVFGRMLAGQGDKVRRETRMRTRQGMCLWVELNVSLLRDPRGAPRRLVVVIEDVTGRRRAEETRAFLAEATAVLLGSLDAQPTLARLSELALASVADLFVLELTQDVASGEPGSAEEGLLVVEARDGTGPGASANSERTREIWRQGRRDVGRGPADEERPALMVEVTGAALASWIGEAAGQALGERLAGGSMVVAPLRGRDGVSLGTLALARRGPERRYGASELALAEGLAYRVALALDNARLYAQAQEAIRARDEFMSIASHELRTPLTPLLLQVENLVEAIAKGRTEQPKMETGLRRMQRQVHRLGSLIDKLLDVTRVTAGRLQMQEETLDLSALIEEVCRRFAEEASKNGCALQVRAPKTLEGRWDRMRLEQVLTNLLANAVKYGRGRPIEVSADPLPDRVRIAVKDQGIGIAPQALARIFERFERAVSARSYGGLGLGLYITRQIVEAHGGSIAVDSAPGAGATFTVELPLRAAERSAILASAPQSQERGS